MLDTPAGMAGLTTQEAGARLAADGPNLLVPEATGRRIKRVLGPLADPMVLLLLLAAPTYLAIGETVDAIVAFVALVPIISVGWVLEARADRTLDKLRRLTAARATVRRDGVDGQVPTLEVVVGDVIQLREGDVVPADAAVLELTQLLVDEASLTGESLPVAKVVGGRDEVSLVWAGTTVLSGRATARVCTTGPATRYGRIGTLVAAVHQPATPLQKGLLRLVRALSVLAAVFCAAVIAAELVNGHGWGQAVIAGVSLAIAAIPEEFSMIYTLYLALGAWRLAQQGALVRRLPSVETLGSTTVICADKTGTMTEGRLRVAALWTGSGAAGGDGPLPTATASLLEAAVLACEPEPFDPLDVAILREAERRGIDPAGLHRDELVADWPFDPVDRYLTHVWARADGRFVAAKGSIEGVLRHCLASDAQRREAEAANIALAAEGARVIAVAGGVRPSGASAGSRREDEAALHLLGLIGFSDPIRDGVADALAACRAAGIRVMMITGDHPATARAVAVGLGLVQEADGVDLIVTGADLDAADPTRIEGLVATANVFARIRPEQKHQLVEALRSGGEVVAMTGDGINDAPALRKADIGIAMGRRGTEAARAAASFVVVDDNFTTIVSAVRDGRRIFDNLTRAFAYLVAFHPPLLFGALVIPLLGRPLLLLPVHLVLLELLLHPVVSLVFQADPADRDAMDRPPRPVGDALRLRSLGRPYAVGSVLAAAFIAEYLVALRAGWPVEEARALAFATLLASQPLLVLTTRSPSRPIWDRDQAWTATLGWVIGGLVATTVAVVLLPPLADLLQLAAFPGIAWVIVIVVAAGTTLWTEPLKRRPGTSSEIGPEPS